MKRYKQHTWRHAPAGTDAFWKCSDCNKLDFNAIPDVDETCSGNISQKIDEEITIAAQAAEIERLREFEVYVKGLARTWEDVSATMMNSHDERVFEGGRIMSDCAVELRAALTILSKVQS